MVKLEVTASAPDSGDSVDTVTFYEDLDEDGKADPEEELGSDDNGADGWSYDWDTKFHEVGDTTLLAVAQDAAKQTSAPASMDASIVSDGANHAPRVDSFSVDTNPVTVGDTVTLTAEASDGDAVDYIVGVGFFVDENGNGKADTAEEVARDEDATDGWSAEWTTSGQTGGSTSILAVSLDSQKTPSPAVSSTLSLLPPVFVSEAAIAEGNVGSSEVEVPVILSVESSDRVTVDYHSNPESAQEGEDYEPVSGSLVFEPGQTSKQIMIPIVGDSQSEDNETFSISLNSPVNGVIGDGEASVLIVDDDVAQIASHQYADGARVSFYDVDPADGTIDPEVAWSWGDFVWGTTEVVVDAGWQGDAAVNTIMLFNSGSETEDLGIAVEGNSSLGSLVDNRPNPSPMGFLASEGPINYVSAPGGMDGVNLNGFTAPGGWGLPEDLDRDGSLNDHTAVYTGGRVGTFIGTGDIEGGVIAEEGVGFAMTQRGDWAGDLVARGGAVGQLLVIDGDIDLRGGRRIASAGTINSIQAIGGDLLGDGVDETAEISVEDGSLWSLMAINGKIDGIATQVQTGGGQPWMGAMGTVLSTGSEEGIRRSCFEVSNRIDHVGVYGPWRQQPGGAWGPAGELSDNVFRTNAMGSVSVSGNASGDTFDVGSGDLGSFHAGGDLTDSDFDVGGSIWWMNAGRAMRRTNVDAGNLNAVSVGSMGRQGGSEPCRLADLAGGVGGEDWWLGIGGRWERVEGTRDYLDDLSA